MKLQNFVFASLVCLFSMIMFSCSQESDQLTDNADMTFIDKYISEDPFEKGLDPEVGPNPRNGSCVGEIQRVHWVRPGYEDTYRIGTTICVECGARQLDCESRYWLRIWENGERVAAVYVVNEDNFCMECPRDGLRVE